MIGRENEKLAHIERMIEEVKENGFGEVVITINDGQITYARKTEATKWPLVVNVVDIVLS